MNIHFQGYPNNVLHPSMRAFQIVDEDHNQLGFIYRYEWGTLAIINEPVGTAANRHEFYGREPEECFDDIRQQINGDYLVHRMSKTLATLGAPGIAGQVKHYQPLENPRC